MEILIKSVITIVIVLGCWKALYWTWTSQIDPRATLKKYISKKPEIADSIVTREPNKIYQSGNPVGDVSGSVENKNGTVVFSEIINTSLLNCDEPFEYQRMKLKVVKIGKRIGLKFDGPVTKKDVAKDVVCEKVND